MPFTIVRQDITKMKVDAIVNAANTELLMGGGVCGAIFRAAGAGKLQEACDRAAPIKMGEAAITPGFRLFAKYVIHAAGPVYNAADKQKCEKLLRSAYIASLKLAAENHCESIAFPLISSGIYGYPKAEALAVATSAISEFIAESEMHVYLAIFDKRSFVVSEQLMGEVADYLDEHYIDKDALASRFMLRVEEEAFAEEKAFVRDEGAPPEGVTTQEETAQPGALPEKAILSEALPEGASSEEAAQPGALPKEMASPCASPKKKMPFGALADLVDHLDEPFSDTLLKLIDSKGKTDVEVYKKANIDRKLFSKIRTGKNYTPRKSTILALAIALELSLDETDDLLERAGYALSHASKFDVIVEYFIVSGKYNVCEINEVLFQYDQPLLGG